jgi:hypothetical protein
VEGVLDCIGNDFALFVSDLWDSLALQISREFAELIAQSLLKLVLVEDMDNIVPERDSENTPDQELPPTMHKSVVGLRFLDFR